MQPANNNTDAAMQQVGQVAAIVAGQSVAKMIARQYAEKAVAMRMPAEDMAARMMLEIQQRPPAELGMLLLGLARAGAEALILAEMEAVK